MEKNIGIDYLRLSLTDRCNLNCLYCTPLQKGQFLSHEEVLRYEEMALAVQMFVKAGVRKVRLTGGEPLIKKDITSLVRMLKNINGLEEIAMTTNGIYLKSMAGQLKDAGLDRVNISIDTLKKEKFKSITGFDYFVDVWAAILESMETGLNPVKLNVILMRGINDDEIIDFVRLIFDYPLIVRFIEFFPTNKRSAKLAHTFIRTDEVKQRIIGYFGAMPETALIRGNGPARYYRIKGAQGAIGFISGCSEDFCSACNRIRMDCSGKIYPCLFSASTHQIRDLLRGFPDKGVMLEYIKEIFKIKYNYSKNTVLIRQLEMSSIGG